MYNPVKDRSHMVHFSVPPVGSLVRLTTKYKNASYYSTEPWTFYTYEGKVLPREHWFRPDQFKLTSDDPLVTFRVISTNNIVDMEVNGASGETSTTDTMNTTVPVAGSKGSEYYVTIRDGKAVNCTCMGYQFRHSCRHLKVAVDSVTK
jgi:hypothetical protein